MCSTSTWVSVTDANTAKKKKKKVSHHGANVDVFRVEVQLCESTELVSWFQNCSTPPFINHACFKKKKKKIPTALPPAVVSERLNRPRKGSQMLLAEGDTREVGFQQYGWNFTLSAVGDSPIDIFFPGSIPTQKRPITDICGRIFIFSKKGKWKLSVEIFSICLLSNFSDLQNVEVAPTPTQHLFNTTNDKLSLWLLITMRHCERCCSQSHF